MAHTGQNNAVPQHTPPSRFLASLAPTPAHVSQKDPAPLQQQVGASHDKLLATQTGRRGFTQLQDDDRAPAVGQSRTRPPAALPPAGVEPGGGRRASLRVKEGERRPSAPTGRRQPRSGNTGGETNSRIERVMGARATSRRSQRTRWRALPCHFRGSPTALRGWGMWPVAWFGSARRQAGVGQTAPSAPS